MEYPLSEKIGNPELLVGREQEFKHFNQWIAGIPRSISKSRVILGRRKSGKTAFIQRLFNRLWSANGAVIPFYISIPETAVWYPSFALLYYRTFASQYISFLERDPTLVNEPLEMDQIRAYGEANSIGSLVRAVDMILHDEEKGHYGLMWDTAYRAPHRIAAVRDERILVMVDEFQYLSTNIYTHENLSGEPVESMPGSFHEVSESKVAPMLATGSYVGWMIDIMTNYLEAGRLSRIPFSPYLKEREGLLAVYRYAEVYNVPITNTTAVYINKLCLADPFFISCVVQSNYPERDLMTEGGVIETVNYEIENKNSELSGTWREYIDKTVNRINDRNGKHMLLHLNKHNQRVWTPLELKKALHLEEDEKIIHRKLLAMHKGDLLQWGPADIDFQGLVDGTLNLILHHRFEKEIKQHQPDLRVGFQAQIAELTSENRSLRGKLSHIKGVMTENQLAATFRSRKRFQLGAFFEGATDEAELNMIDVQTRFFLRRKDSKKQELDVVSESSDGRVLLVEVRNRQKASNVKDIEDFQEKVALYKAQYPNQAILTAFLSLGSFTDDALGFCQEQKIACSTELQYF